MRVSSLTAGGTRDDECSVLTARDPMITSHRVQYKIIFLGEMSFDGTSTTCIESDLIPGSQWCLHSYFNWGNREVTQ